MMREADLLIIEYLRTKWGPFSCIFGDARDDIKFKCDVCDGAFEKLMVCRSSKAEHKVAYVCLGECGQKFFTEAVYQELWSKINKGTEGVIKVSTEMKEVARDVLKASSILAEERRIDNHVVVEQAIKYSMAGFGKGWKIVPGIIDWHLKGNLLTNKQVACLIKFNASCKREVG